jgi:hypothetical protein
MSTTTHEARHEAEQARIKLAEKLVSREVIHCASTLVAEIIGTDLLGDDEASYLCVQDDWISAAEENGFDWPAHVANNYTTDDDDMLVSFANGKHNACRDYCEHFGIEPHTSEALEHWIVTGYLADKLEERGEMIARDILGFDAIWGRTCSGQAIALDCVIQEIASAQGWKAEAVPA